MEFKFVYSKKGYGKTKYILDEIKKSKNKKILILIPSHNTFMMENRVIEYLGEGVLSRVEIMDFKKLTHKFLSIFKGKNQNKISNLGKNLLVNYILRKNNDKFIYFKNNYTMDFSDDILETLIDFKSYNIDNNAIDNILKELPLDSEFYKKLYDLKNINNLYEEYLEKNYLDSLDDMKKVNDIIYEDISIFNGYEIYIDGFEIFTYYQYEFLKIILNRSKKIVMTLNIDRKSNSIIYNQIYKIRDKMLDILLSSNKYDIQEIDISSVDKNIELKYLDENYLNYNVVPYEKEIKNIFLNKCKNNFYEIEELCKNIRYLIINENYRYKDMGVICRDIDAYENFIKVSFDEFNIPYFIDNKNGINSNIFSIFLVSIFEIFDYDFSYTSLFKYIKSGFLDLDSNDLFLIENFSIENGISGYKWKKDFTMDMYIKYTIQADESNNQDLDKVNNIRRKIIDPLVSFFKRVNNQNSVNHYIRELYDFIVNLGVLDRVKKMCDKFNLNNDFISSNELFQIVNRVFSLFDEVNDIFSNEIMTFSDFGKILIDSISKIEISHIPMRYDEIIIGDIPRIKIGDYKALFVIGCNSVNFPKSYKKEDLINDLEKNFINKLGIEFSGTNIDKSLSENYMLYSIINIPKDMLYISYSISDMDSLSMTPSIIISNICKIFPNIKESNVTILNNEFSIDNIYSEKSTLNNFIINLRNSILNNSISQILLDLYKFYDNNIIFNNYKDIFFSNLYRKNSEYVLDLNLIDYIYKNTKFSISSIETYSKCSFKYFLDYVLKIKRRRLFSFENYDYGNILHFMMEHICKVITREYDFKNSTREEIEKFIIDYFNKILLSENNSNFILNTNFKFRAFSNKIKRTITDSIFFTNSHLLNSEFYHKYYEFEFGKNNSQIYIDLENGKKVLFTGKIDRIDFCKHNDETFINIIDYKSRDYNIDYGKIYSTLNIQTIAYMNYIIKLYKEKFNVDISPCGIFYFTIHRQVIKNKKGLDILSESIKQHKYSGLITDDIEKLKLIDKNIVSDKESFIPIKINKNGELSKQNSHEKILSDCEFYDILKFVDDSIKDVILRIYNGSISVYPILEDSSYKKCINCDYTSICKFTKKKDNFRLIQDLNKESFFNLIRKENE